MEQNAPAPSPASYSAQIICQWCNKPMDSTATNCPSCGKLRKDIYNDKIKSYIFCALGGLGIGFSFKFFGGHRNNDFENFYNDGGGGSSSNSTGIILLILGILLAIAGTYYYIKVSKQLKSWWWV